MAEAAITVEALAGDALQAALPDLARLRIAVFREWPYLYEGSLDYESRYLAHFAEGTNAVIIAARDGDKTVGAATAAPLISHTEEFAPLFQAHGYDPERVFYLGESVLLPEYRGRGLGHAFFDGREKHARSIQGPKGAFTHAAFCGVVRGQTDPRRPAAYVPLDGFWRKRGYAPIDGLRGSYSWREIGGAEETAHPMQFWVRQL